MNFYKNIQTVPTNVLRINNVHCCFVIGGMRSFVVPLAAILLLYLVPYYYVAALNATNSTTITDTVTKSVEQANEQTAKTSEMENGRQKVVVIIGVLASVCILANITAIIIMYRRNRDKTGPSPQLSKYAQIVGNNQLNQMEQKNATTGDGKEGSNPTTTTSSISSIHDSPTANYNYKPLPALTVASAKEGNVNKDGHPSEKTAESTTSGSTQSGISTSKNNAATSSFKWLFKVDKRAAKNAPVKTNDFRPAQMAASGQASGPASASASTPASEHAPSPFSPFSPFQTSSSTTSHKKDSNTQDLSTADSCSMVDMATQPSMKLKPAAKFRLAKK